MSHNHRQRNEYRPAPHRNSSPKYYPTGKELYLLKMLKDTYRTEISIKARDITYDEFIQEMIDYYKGINQLVEIVKSSSAK